MFAGSTPFYSIVDYSLQGQGHSLNQRALSKSRPKDPPKYYRIACSALKAQERILKAKNSSINGNTSAVGFMAKDAVNILKTTRYHQCTPRLQASEDEPMDSIPWKRLHTLWELIPAPTIRGCSSLQHCPKLPFIPMADDDENDSRLVAMPCRI